MILLNYFIYILITYFIIFGIYLIKKKRPVIHSTLGYFLILISCPYFFIFIDSLIKNLLRNNVIKFNLIYFLVFIVGTFSLAILHRRLINGFIIYNIKKNNLYETVCKVLNDMEINYKCKNSKIYILDKDKIGQLIIISYYKFNQFTNIYLKHIKKGFNKNKFQYLLKIKLDKIKLNNFSYSGLIYILFGLILIIVRMLLKYR